MNIKPIKLLSGSHADTGITGQGCFMNVIAYLNGESQVTDQSTCVCPTIRPIAIFLNDFADDEQRQRLLPFVLRAMGTTTEDRAVMLSRVTAVVRYAEFNARLAAESAESAKSAAESAAESAEYAAESAESAKYAAKYAAKSAAKYAAKYAAKSAESAKYAAKYAAESAEYAKYAAESAESAESAKYAKSAAESAAESAESAKYAAESAESAKYAKSAARREAIFQAGLDFLEEVCPPAEPCTQVILDRAARLFELAN